MRQPGLLAGAVRFELPLKRAPGDLTSCGVSDSQNQCNLVFATMDMLPPRDDSRCLWVENL
jgi:hypothetical protein